MQRLIQPINHMLVGLGFKSPKYKQIGVVKAANGAHMDHFGADWWSGSDDRTLYAMGDGVVFAAGTDSTFGNAVVVIYRGAWNHAEQQAHDVAVRCFHLAKIYVKAGQEVTKDTRLGIIGDTGKFCDGVHVHIEIDTDVGDPMGVPAINNTNMFHWVTKNSATIQNPAHFVHTKITAPDLQVSHSAGEWYRDPGRDYDWHFPKTK